MDMRRNWYTDSLRLYMWTSRTYIKMQSPKKETQQNVVGTVYSHSLYAGVDWNVVKIWEENNLGAFQSALLLQRYLGKLTSTYTVTVILGKSIITLLTGWESLSKDGDDLKLSYNWLITPFSLLDFSESANFNFASSTVIMSTQSRYRRVLKLPSHGGKGKIFI